VTMPPSCVSKKYKATVNSYSGRGSAMALSRRARNTAAMSPTLAGLTAGVIT
jgi:hypothetical protein